MLKSSGHECESDRTDDRDVEDVEGAELNVSDELYWRPQASNRRQRGVADGERRVDHQVAGAQQCSETESWREQPNIRKHSVPVRYRSGNDKICRSTSQLHQSI